MYIIHCINLQKKLYDKFVFGRYTLMLKSRLPTIGRPFVRPMSIADNESTHF